MKTPKSSALQLAYDAVHGDRQRDYGSPAANHERTAALWSAFLGIRIAPRDVCWLNVLQKLSRDRHRPTEDNEVDIAGYAENAFMMREQRESNTSEPGGGKRFASSLPHALGCAAKIGGPCRCHVEHASGCSATFGGGNPCDCKSYYVGGAEFTGRPSDTAELPESESPPDIGELPESEFPPTTETSDDEGTESIGPPDDLDETGEPWHSVVDEGPPPTANTVDIRYHVDGVVSQAQWHGFDHGWSSFSDELNVPIPVPRPAYWRRRP